MEKRLRRYTKWLLVLSVVGICGCAGTALQHDYANYSSVYADSNNKQLLMNLAREQHDEPIYFVQLASISSEYQFSGSVGFSPSYVHNSPGSFLSSESTTTGATPPTGGNTFSEGFGSYFKHVLTLGGSVNSGFLQEPVYQFVPLTGSNFVQAILTPISDKVFLTFYDQGYPADMLTRIMVESVQTKTVTTNRQQKIETALVPVTYYQTNLEQFTNSVVLDLVQTNTVTLTNTVTATNALTLGVDATNAFRLALTSIPMVTTNQLAFSTTKQVSFRVPYRTVLEYRSITNYDIIYSTNLETWVNNPEDKSYPEFLEFSFFLRKLQKYKLLTVHPADTQGGTVVYRDKEARLYDLANAVQSGLSAKYDTNSDQYLVTKPEQNLSLQLSISNETSFVDFTNDNPVTTYANVYPTNILANQSGDITNVVNTLNVGANVGLGVYTNIETLTKVELSFTTNGARIAGIVRLPNYVTNYVTVTNYITSISTVNSNMYERMMELAVRLENSNTRLKMRTVEVALYDVANEAQLFQARTNQSEARTNRTGYTIRYKDYDGYGTFATVTSTNQTVFAVRPVLMLNYDRFAMTNLITATQTSYEGKEYTIGDFKGEALENQISNTHKPPDLLGVILPEKSPQTLNRDTFTVLNYLFSQVTIDTQKLPVQQLIQIQ